MPEVITCEKSVLDMTDEELVLLMQGSLNKQYRKIREAIQNDDAPMCAIMLDRFADEMQTWASILRIRTLQAL